MHKTSVACLMAIGAIATTVGTTGQAQYPGRQEPHRQADNGTLRKPTVEEVTGPSADRSRTYTAAFLGEPTDWKNVTIVVRQISPLFGGREYYIRGNGCVTIVVIKRELRATDNVVESRFVLDNAQEQVTALLRKIRDADLLAIPVEQPDRRPRTCNDPPLFLLRNGAGQVHALPVIRRAPTEVYEDILHEVATLIRLTRDRQPQREGVYDGTFVPSGFEWAAAVLQAARARPWAPVATPEDLARAEERSRVPNQAQLEATAKNMAEEARQGGAK